jgi:hypothetical protein
MPFLFALRKEIEKIMFIVEIITQSKWIYPFIIIWF